MTHMPGDDDWLLDEDDEFDPLEDMEPIPGDPDPPADDPNAVKPPQGSPLETDAEWNSVQWQPAEKGQAPGYNFQRFRDKNQGYAKVVFEFTEQPPPHDKIQTAAGTAWRLETTRVRGKTIEAFYVRIPHEKTHS